MIHIGFTGTRSGMSLAQLWTVEELLLSRLERDAVTVHHGDCVGADAEFHALALRRGVRIVIHPPIDENLRAFCKDADEWRPACTHLARNRCIVTECNVLIAAPYQAVHQKRGGTWYTIDYARKLGRPLKVVNPDGMLGPFSTWELP